MEGIVSYRYITEQCREFNIKYPKIDIVSPTYMVEQCLEKRKEFYLEYVTLYAVQWLNVTRKENIILSKRKLFLTGW